MLKFAKEDLKLLLATIMIVVFGFSGVYIAYAVEQTQTPTLTATVAAVLTFTVSTDVFGSLTAGSNSKFATSTLNVNTNNISGWNVTLYGNDQSPTDTVMDLTTDASVGITDQTEWVPGSATTTAGNALRISSFDNSENVLAFRTMTASSTNGAAFISSDWWGTTDAYVDSATCLWAGIASSTVQRQIGNAGSGSYSANDHLNTALYYLKVHSSQQAGDYSGGLTYTATSNP